jgi:hypothetical protein
MKNKRIRGRKNKIKINWRKEKNKIKQNRRRILFYF